MKKKILSVKKTNHSITLPKKIPPLRLGFFLFFLFIFSFSALSIFIKPSTNLFAVSTISGTVVVQDTFAGRSVTNGWGTASDGNVWTVQSGSTTHLSVGSNEGHVTNSGAIPGDYITLGTQTTHDIEAVARYTTGSFSDDDGRIILRFTDTNNYYVAGFASPNGTPELDIYKSQNGTTTQLSTVSFSPVNNTYYWERVRVQTQGSSAVISVKAWKDGTTEPTNWNVTDTDTEPLPAGKVGIDGWDGGATWNMDHFAVGSLDTITPTPTATPPPTMTPTATPTPIPQAIQHVITIVMENKDWSNIKGSTSAPYINSLLTRPDVSYASNYHQPTGLHPSEPNYVWLEAGTNSFSDHVFTTDDNPSNTNSTSSTQHISTLLTNAGKTWRSYQENKPSGCPIIDNGSFVARHDPFVFFQDVSGNPPNNSTSGQCSNIVDYSQLATDLSNNTIANYNFVTPNICNDMHDASGCVGATGNAIKNGDNWLANTLPTILNSSAYQSGNTAVFITWDEGATLSGTDTDNPIGMIVLSSQTKGNGYTNSIHYDHSSYVKTIQNIFTLSPYLGNASSATDFSDLFHAGVIPAPTPTPTPSPTPTVTATPTPPPGGGISLRAAATGNNGAGGSTLTISQPAGTSSGDVMVAHVVVRTAGNTITPPAGWSLVLRQDSSSSISTASYVRVAGSTEPASYTWSFGTAGQASGGIASYIGVNTTTPVDASHAQYNASSRNVDNTGVTTTTANDMLVYAVGITVVTTVNVPSSFTQQWSTSSNSSTTSEMSQKIFSSVGATGRIHGTHNGGANSNITFLIALKPK